MDRCNAGRFRTETGKREPNEARNSEANHEGRARAREGAVKRTPVPGLGADGGFRLLPGFLPDTQNATRYACHGKRFDRSPVVDCGAFVLLVLANQ